MFGATVAELVAVGGYAPEITNVAANVINGTTAELIGDVVSTGMLQTAVHVYYGTSDGKMVKADWGATNIMAGFQGEGILTNTVSDLTPNMSYFFRYYATNTAGETWADTSTVFNTEAEIGIFGNDLEITSGSISTSTGDGTDFGEFWSVRSRSRPS